jgi:hypothetical protein
VAPTSQSTPLAIEGTLPHRYHNTLLPCYPLSRLHRRHSSAPTTLTVWTLLRLVATSRPGLVPSPVAICTPIPHHPQLFRRAREVEDLIALRDVVDMLLEVPSMFKKKKEPLTIGPEQQTAAAKLQTWSLAEASLRKAIEGIKARSLSKSWSTIEEVLWSQPGGEDALQCHPLVGQRKPRALPARSRTVSSRTFQHNLYFLLLQTLIQSRCKRLCAPSINLGRFNRPWRSGRQAIRLHALPPIMHQHSGRPNEAFTSTLTLRSLTSTLLRDPGAAFTQ